MIPERHVEAYKNIHAPETLRERVMQIPLTPRERKRVLPALASAAAVMLLMGGMALLLGIGRKDAVEQSANSGLYMPIAGEDRRLVVPCGECLLDVTGVRADGVMLNVSVAKKAELSVTSGALSIVGEGLDTPAMMRSVDIDSDTVVFWNIDTGNCLGAKLILKFDGTETAFTLLTAEGGITLERIQ